MLVELDRHVSDEGPEKLIPNGAGLETGNSVQ